MLHGELVWNDPLVLVDHINSYNNTGLLLSVLTCNFNIILIRDPSFITSWGGGGVVFKEKGVFFLNELFWGEGVIFYLVQKVRGVTFEDIHKVPTKCI